MIPKSLAEQGKVQFLPKQPFTFTPVVACGQLYALLDARRLRQRSSTDPAWRHHSSAPQVDDIQRVTPEILKTACCHVFLTSFTRFVHLKDLPR